MLLLHIHRCQYPTTPPERQASQSAKQPVCMEGCLRHSALLAARQHPPRYALEPASARHTGTGAGSAIILMHHLPSAFTRAQVLFTFLHIHFVTTAHAAQSPSRPGPSPAAGRAQKKRAVPPVEGSGTASHGMPAPGGRPLLC